MDIITTFYALAFFGMAFGATLYIKMLYKRLEAAVKRERKAHA